MLAFPDFGGGRHFFGSVLSKDKKEGMEEERKEEGKQEARKEGPRRREEEAAEGCRGRGDTPMHVDSWRMLFRW